MNNSFYQTSRSRGVKVYRSHSFTGKRLARPERRNGAYIDPLKFVNKAVEIIDQVTFIPQHSFRDFALSEFLQQNIIAKGYTIPTPIQDGAIQPILDGRDLIGLANTGTGKTAAFILPIINHLQKTARRGNSVLIMVPTRELATQIDEEFKFFAKGLSLYAVLCVGGASMNRQISEIRRGPQVVIGTPGRLKDLVNQRILRLEATEILVLDEADRMLDMGFIRDIRFLIGQLPTKRQSLCFSATMPTDIERLVREILRDPVTISVRQGVTSAGIDQDVIKATSKEHKIQILSQMLRQPEFGKVLVFGQTKWGVQKLADTLAESGLAVESIHGNKSQPQRQKALKAFKENLVQVLVATDVAARGLDIPDVSHVINFDQPNTYEDYIHRIGRTGRAGKAGKALTFVS